jgi:competence protein ComFC
MWMISYLFEILFPPSCLGCRKAGTSLCDRCIKLSRKVLSTPYPYTISLFDFKDPLVKRAIHALKYYHRRDLALPLADALTAELKNIPHLETYTLVPIPMPRFRKLFRGYNQAELIAQQLSRVLTIPVQTNVLKRSTSPTRQVTMHTKTERIKNQHGSFSCDLDLSGMNFIIIDDVTTTGATLNEARSVLLKKNAKQVYAATVAH